VSLAEHHASDNDRTMLCNFDDFHLRTYHIKSFNLDLNFDRKLKVVKLRNGEKWIINFVPNVEDIKGA
jgi:hypothetical protein